MKVKIKNIGLIDDAELDVKDLTIVCGENSTGKTYVTYAIYGFFKLWRRFADRVIRSDVRKERDKNGTYQFDLSSMFDGKINNYLRLMSKEYSLNLHVVFATNKNNFTESSVEFSIGNELSLVDEAYERTITDGPSGKVIASLKKESGSGFISVFQSSAGDESLGSVSREDSIILDFVVDSICEIVFKKYIPNVFIASAERTGSAIFRKELDFARSRMIEAISSLSDNEIKNPFKIIQSMNVGYAMPIQQNVDFVRQVESLDANLGPLAESNPELLDSFDAILGGKYKVVKNSLYFIPKGSSKNRFTMAESSSCVRALLDISFYIRCVASAGDILMIDEPELNLHPKNQRYFARFLCQLVNCGIKVFITTHSDYIIKEINTLIMINSSDDAVKFKMMNEYGYLNEQFIDSKKINLVMTDVVPMPSNKRKRIRVLTKANIHHALGIEAKTFDSSIDEMNDIQTEIMLTSSNSSRFFD